MLSYQELIAQALELKALREDLASATYTVIEHVDRIGITRMFVASFDLDHLVFNYTVTDPNFIQVKALESLSPDALVAFGNFVEKMEEYGKGGEHPYKHRTVAENPEIVPEKVVDVHAVAKGDGIANKDYDDDEASLT